MAGYSADGFILLCEPDMNFKAIFIFLAGSPISCSNPGDSSRPQLIEPVNEIQLDISEPSGLSFGYANQSYWVVSDGPGGKIYHVNLSGNVVRQLNYVANDMEGISYNQSENTLWIVEEQLREVVKLDLNGNILNTRAISVSYLDDHGLEGIAVINNSNVWISHEKSPRILLQLNEQFQVESQINVTKVEDFSGLSYNSMDSALWIISDESEILIKWSLDNKEINKYSLPIPKAEGVAINPDDNTIHIVSDQTSKIYVFNIPE